MTGALTAASIAALRKRLGLSQVEFAALLGVSNVTVNRWERGRSRPRAGMSERLRQLERDGQAARASRLPALSGNLPPRPTPLIGRDDELAAVIALMDSRPLVTVIGTAGMGKTRLAIEVGHRTAPQWPGGVWFVDLSTVPEQAGLVYAVASVLGVHEARGVALAERLADHVRTRRLLLILDNCEHLGVAAAELATSLLARGGASRLVATSRAPLGMAGETRYALGPLAPSDAHELFLQRARDHQPELAPDVEQRRAIAGICRRLDHLPLAIELAAARARLLSVEQIASRLDHRFALLRQTAGAMPRQQALDAAIAWSYELLGPAEAALFRRLGSFAGSFDLTAVEAVAGAGQTLDLPESLARHSMIVVEHDAATRAGRYHLLESLAEYARLRLADAGEAEEAARRHAAYFAAFASAQASDLRGADQAARLDRLDREHDNLIAALEWLIASNQDGEALAMAAALGRYWRVRGRYAEGSAWLERVLAPRPAAPDAVWLEALQELGFLQYHIGRLDDARRTLERAIALAITSGDRGQEAQARNTLGVVLTALLDFDQAEAAHDAALAQFLALDDRAQAALSQRSLGTLANLRGDHDAAERAYLQAWALVQRSGDVAAEAAILSDLGELYGRLGQPVRAFGYLERAAELLRRLGDPDHLAVVMVNMAEARLLLGDGVAAARMAEEAVGRLRHVGQRAHLAGALYVEAAARAALGQRSRALALFRESLELYYQLHDWLDVVYLVEAIARLLAAGGAPMTAARLMGGASVLRERERMADYPLFDYDGTVASVHGALGLVAAAAHWDDGRRLSLDDLVAEAMFVGAVGDGDPIHVLVMPGSAPTAAHRQDVLTPRQTDVLRLVAAGQSNREIGRALHISERTVERHLTAIFGALGVDRRPAAVAVALAAGLLDAPKL